MSIAGSDTADIFLTCEPSRIADLKLVLLGESSVGKSSILQRFQNNTFSNDKTSTIGAAFISKKILHKESDDSVNLINMQIWDTAGQERFHGLTPLYYRNSNLALIVFSLVDESSFKRAEFWLNELKDYIDTSSSGTEPSVPKMNIIFVGNKLDLLARKETGDKNNKLTVDSFEDCPFIDRIESFLRTHKNMVCQEWFKTSAKLNIGISNLFNYIIDNVDESLYHKYNKDGDKKDNLIDFYKPAGGNSCEC